MSGVERLRWCDHKGGLGPPFPFCEICEPKSQLQLLVIDLGDSCVVKVEKGDVELRYPSGILMFRRGAAPFADVVHSAFSEVRAALDVLEDKPVPRIERATDAERCIVHYLHHGNGNYEPIMQSTLDALSELAGHPLPVYEGKQGKWTEIQTLNAPLAIWRYTR